jgi:hypothetical protein
LISVPTQTLLAHAGSEIASSVCDWPFRRPWLTWLKSKALTPGMRAFHDWLVHTLKTDEETQ